ncbi:tyrosine-type recombinase/integrase [Solimonas marina]|uniref:Integrase arm-type DNA-binding domain-containing protein n=1 Tax=Solimonas marina TaxID=2714601 RepID=A0A969WE21_9GAMM|nr:integrase arm-type DNA-binding domain-containing protein [Solimonas marina]NKF23070.1 integrase arm-type DNA-binding domain-containing protein [Solimonas marina]
MFTDTQIRNAKPKAKPYKLPRERGLILLINPNGAKWWRFAYRFAGREQLLSFGTYPEVPLSLARERRDDARRQLAVGVNPSDARKEARRVSATATLSAFAAVVERWKADELSGGTADYQKRVMRMLERDVLPHIGQRPIADIKPRELIAVFDRIRERGVEETARRARTVVGQVFRYAIRRGIAELDPTQPLRGERRVKPVKHFAAFTDPADVARLMQAIYGYRGTIEVRAALKLSALLFQRPGEIRQMQWNELDLDAAQWRYVVSKSRRHTSHSHIVPLPAQAVEILRELQPLTGQAVSLRPDAPLYVFPSTKTRMRPMSNNAVRTALRNMGFTNDEMTAHGFRATARSLLAELGWKTDAIERQLSHKAAGPLGAAYDRAAYLDERKAMMQAWADYLDALRRRTSVVPLRAA